MTRNRDTEPRRSDPTRGEPVDPTGPVGSHTVRNVHTILAAGASDATDYRPPVHPAPTDRLFPDVN